MRSLERISLAVDNPQKVKKLLRKLVEEKLRQEQLQVLST